VDLPAVLDEVGLGELADELDDVENWSARLSLGEQQSICPYSADQTKTPVSGRGNVSAG
jgi:hypothetical protein